MRRKKNIVLSVVMCMFVYMCDGFRSHRKKLNGEAHIYMYVCVVF